MPSSIIEIAETDRVDDALVELWVESWKATRSDIDFAARRGWFVRHMAGLRDGGALTLRAEADGALLGFVTINPVTFYLDQLAVRSRAFGTGVADRLMDGAKRRSPERIDLLVNQDNPRAIRFYEKAGFRITGAGGTNFPLWSMTWTPARANVSPCRSI